MITRPRVAVVGIALIIPFVTVIANPSWAATLGINVRELSEWHETVRVAAEQDEGFETEYAEIRGRIEAKEVLISNLIAGSRSLADVATQFSVLNEGYEHHLTVIRQLYQGATDEEKMVWNVLDFARNRLSELPVWHRLEITCRLHIELQSLSAEFAAQLTN